MIDKEKKKKKKKTELIFARQIHQYWLQLCMTVMTRNEFVQQTWRCHGERRVTADENLNLLAQINACARTRGTLWLKMCSKEAIVSLSIHWSSSFSLLKKPQVYNFLMMFKMMWLNHPIKQHIYMYYKEGHQQCNWMAIAIGKGVV